MHKFAAKILDIRDEALDEVFKKISTDMPEFVNNAVMPDSKELDLISDYDFAIVYYNNAGDKSRKYLLVDPGNIYLSAKYFLDSRVENQNTWPKIAQAIIIRSILSRAEKFGISKYPIFNKLREIRTALESEGLMKRVPEQNIYDEKLFARAQHKEDTWKDQQARSGKDAKSPSEKLSSARCFALNTGDDYWVDRPMYDISTPELTKKASDYFMMYKAAMPLLSKRKFAKALTKQADALNVAIDPQVKLYGSGEIDTKLAYETMLRRAKLCKEEHRKLAAEILHFSPKMSADELIAAVDAFDKIALEGDPRRFSLPDPVLSTVSMGGDDKIIFDSGMKQVTLRSLKRIIETKADKLQEVFDTKIVDSLKANPEKAFKALPQPYKKIIAGLAN
jgi:hypothetical protein